MHRQTQWLHLTLLCPPPFLSLSLFHEFSFLQAGLYWVEQFFNKFLWKISLVVKFVGGPTIFGVTKCWDNIFGDYQFPGQICRVKKSLGQNISGVKFIGGQTLMEYKNDGTNIFRGQHLQGSTICRGPTFCGVKNVGATNFSHLLLLP